MNSSLICLIASRPRRYRHVLKPTRHGGSRRYLKNNWEYVWDRGRNDIPLEYFHKGNRQELRSQDARRPADVARDGGIALAADGELALIGSSIERFNEQQMETSSKLVIVDVRITSRLATKNIAVDGVGVC